MSASSSSSGAVSFAQNRLPGSSSSSSGSGSSSSSRIPSADPTSSTPPSTASPSVPKKKKAELQGWKHSAAGSIGGMAGAIVTSPFDVIKTRLQSDMFRHHATPDAVKTAAGKGASRTGISGGLYQFVDTIHLIRRINAEEGWRALYKGLGPSLVGIIPARAINFYFYPTSKAYLAERFPNAPTEKAGQTSEDSPVIHLAAAVIAGIMTATGTNPIWVVKTRLQLSAKQKPLTAAAVGAAPPLPTTSSPLGLPKSIAASAAALSATTATATSGSATATATRAGSAPLNAFGMTMQIIRADGIRGLYRGLSASYLGVSEGVIQWVLYERLKRLNSNSSPDPSKTSLLSYTASIVGASGTAKAVASLITYPHEVIRTRLRQPPPASLNGQKKYKSLVQTLRLVVAEEGVGALYGGLTAHMFRVVPNAACMFLIYEVVAARLGS